MCKPSMNKNRIEDINDFEYLADKEDALQELHITKEDTAKEDAAKELFNGNAGEKFDCSQYIEINCEENL